MHPFSDVIFDEGFIDIQVELLFVGLVEPEVIEIVNGQVFGFVLLMLLVDVEEFVGKF